VSRLDYVRDGAAIYRQSFATIRAEADLAAVPPDLEKAAVRMIHACGMVDLVDDLAFSPGVGTRARAALQAGAPILKPQGRRLGGEEIKAGFAGRRLAGVVWPHWGTRAVSLAFWGADGERQEFHPARPERRIAARRWWVEDDRLCTSEDGCNVVLADGRFLHAVTGEPPRFLTTFAADAPGG
jgi:hypothetical protein